MLCIISPAKTLDFETPLTVTTYTQPDFLSQSEQLIKRLRQLSSTDIETLMDISPALAALNVNRYRDWTPTFTPNNARQAALAFNGDVYEGLDASGLPPEHWEFAQNHLRILSGLYGLLRPLDLIQPYRLEMGSKLENSHGKNLYAFWGDQLTLALNKAAQKVNAAALVNLASDEYFKAIKVSKLDLPVMTPVFEEWKGDTYKIISFYAKRARGLMARYIIVNAIQHPEALKQFNYEGYTFSEEASMASNGKKLIFRRKQT